MTSAGGDDNAPPPRGIVVGMNDIAPVSMERISTGFAGTDKILGYDSVLKTFGVAAKGGQTIQLYGGPGAGKSTLLLQMLREISKQRRRALYIAGEESLAQIKARADRIGKFNANMHIVDEQDLDEILRLLDELRPEVCAIDSVQTLSVEEYATGSLMAITVAARELYRFCQQRGIGLILIVQINKAANDFSGPKALEHIVDTTLFLKTANDNTRVLVSSKNRFGSAPDGQQAPSRQRFEMTANGLFEIDDEPEHAEEPPVPSPPMLTSVP